MKPFVHILRATLVHILLLFLLVGCKTQFQGESDEFSSGRGFPYYAWYAAQINLIEISELPDTERLAHKQGAYYFAFEYWLLHRSHDATLKRLPKFETALSNFIQRRILPSIPNPNDPLLLKKYYRDGVLNTNEHGVFLANTLGPVRLERFHREVNYSGSVSEFKAWLALEQKAP